jgi:hypothetical protein
MAQEREGEREREMPGERRVGSTREVWQLERERERERQQTP